MIHAIFHGLARGMAWLGGLVLSGLILLTCLSIAGRLLNGLLHEIGTGWGMTLVAWGVGPVQGDFELVEAGMAFAIFAFLPLCQISAGHASVDIFTRGLPPAVQRVLRCAIDAVFAAVLVLIAVQLFAGMQSKLNSGQTSFLLGFPVWWGYALALSGAAVAALVGLYVAAARGVEMATGQRWLPADKGPDH